MNNRSYFNSFLCDFFVIIGNNFIITFKIFIYLRYGDYDSKL